MCSSVSGAAGLSEADRIVRTRPLTCSKIEHVIEYIRTSERIPQEGTDMTVLDGRRPAHRSTPGSGARAPRPDIARRPVAHVRRHQSAHRRPAGAPLHFRGSGIAVSTAPHTRRPVSTSLTMALAGLSALITLWLGALAQFSSERVAMPATVAAALGVVEVQAGETLEQLAGRVLPEAPVVQTVERIRALNKLETASPVAGRTLIAPVG